MSLNLQSMLHWFCHLVACDVQGMLVHPGWHAVMPGVHTISEVFLALESGVLDLPVQISCIGPKMVLRDLTTTPAHQHSSCLIELTQQVIGGMRSMEVHGDAAHRIALSAMGKSSQLCFYGCYQSPTDFAIMWT